MNAKTEDVDLIRRYLLSESSEAESAAVEWEYFTRQETLDVIAAVEQDLIEAYLSETLAPERRHRFETHYLASPVHRQRVAIARALRDRAAPRRRWTSMAPLLALAASLMVTTLGTYWYLQSRPTGAEALVLTLPAVLERGEGLTPLAQVGGDVSSITLRLERAAIEAAPPYQVLLRTVEGEEIWRGPATAVSAEGAGPRPLIAEVTIPVERLASGDYVVVLQTGAAEPQELQRYYFRLLRH